MAPIAETCRRVTVVDLSGDELRGAGIIELEASPESVRVSPNGRTLALSLSGEARERIALLSVRDGAFGVPAYFNLGELAGAASGSLDATAVEWHPSGTILAVNLNRRDAVLFLQVQRASDGSDPELRPLGAPVPVGRDPFVGRFTPDGAHYLTADWGRNFAASDLAGRLPTSPSTLTMIRVDQLDAHRVVAQIAGDRSSEGLAVSPDGRWAATLKVPNVTRLRPALA